MEFSFQNIILIIGFIIMISIIGLGYLKLKILNIELIY